VLASASAVSPSPASCLGAASRRRALLSKHRDWSGAMACAVGKQRARWAARGQDRALRRAHVTASNRAQGGSIVKRWWAKDGQHNCEGQFGVAKLGHRHGSLDQHAPREFACAASIITLARPAWQARRLGKEPAGISATKTRPCQHSSMTDPMSTLSTAPLYSAEFRPLWEHHVQIESYIG
jgi:hypothetical protein